MKLVFRIFLLFASLAILGSCAQEETSSPAAKAPTPPSGHQRMVSMLDSLAKNARPEENYHLNLKKAALLKAEAEKEQNISKRLNFAFRYALQMLAGGNADEAISVMGTILQNIGGYESALTHKNKPLFEKLAIAYLRKGELDNCVNNHTSASCIFPLQQEGIHSLTSGSENAIKVYSKILNQYPDDLNSKYLINVAYMTLGQYPKGVPAQYRLPGQMFGQKGSIAPFQNVAVELGVDVNGLAGGCCVEDFDNDGFLDILASSYMYGDQVNFFRNNGAGGFEDLTPSSGLTGITGGLNMVHGDYNNDGFEDVFILRGGWLGQGGRQPNSLLRNNGDGTFTDVTIESRIFSLFPTQTAIWVDLNMDGWLDLFIGNETGKYEDVPENVNIDQTPYIYPCEAYLNNGDGTFREDAKSMGLDIVGYVKGVAADDINRDGMPDIFVSVLNGPNSLFINRGIQNEKPVFEDIAARAGVLEPNQSFPTWFMDYNNDGYPDIFAIGYDLSQMRNVSVEFVREWMNENPAAELPRVFRNNGDETFTDVSRSMRLNKVMFGMGANFGDLDNDGFEDLYVGTGTPELNSIVPNRMFRNVGGKYFEEITNAGFGHIQKGHGVGFGDMDNDGDQDIYAVMGGAFQGDFAQNALFENPGSEAAWVTLDLVGTKANKSAIGTRVELVVTEKDGKSHSLHRTVTTGASFGANSLALEIGLGDAVAIEKAVIHWPNGANQAVEVPGLPLRNTIRIVEGQEAQFEVLKRKAVPFVKNKTHHHHH